MLTCRLCLKIYNIKFSQVMVETGFELIKILSLLSFLSFECIDTSKYFIRIALNALFAWSMSQSNLNYCYFVNNFSNWINHLSWIKHWKSHLKSFFIVSISFNFFFRLQVQIYLHLIDCITLVVLPHLARKLATMVWLITIQWAICNHTTICLKYQIKVAT